MLKLFIYLTDVCTVKHTMAVMLRNVLLLFFKFKFYIFNYW